MSLKKQVSYDFLDEIKPEEFSALHETDTSDTGSVNDDYLSDEEICNRYSFLSKPEKKQTNQYKKQFYLPKKEPLTTQLQEEAYNSD